VDVWDDTGNSIVEHVALVDDFEVAEATYRGALAIGAHYGRAADKPRVFLNVASRIEL
jgi:hypothetical protein